MTPPHPEKWDTHAGDAQPVGWNLEERQSRQPNIVIIWGDDVGQFNISAYNPGMMGYKTPYLDRIAKEGALAAALTPSTGPHPSHPGAADLK